MHENVAGRGTPKGCHIQYEWLGFALLNVMLFRKGATHQQVIKNLSDFFDTAKRNQIVLSAALEMSKDRYTISLVS